MLEAEQLSIYKASGFRTHLGFSTMEFAAANLTEAVVIVKAYGAEHGIDTRKAVVCASEPIIAAV